MSALLNGLRVLVLEDEFLIAMDVEQLCRDNGAADVIVAGALSGIDLDGSPGFDVAIVDLMLGGVSTLDLARQLRARAIPFVFASGYSSTDDIVAEFTDIPMVPKPYSGADLIEAVAAVAGREAAPQA